MYANTDKFQELQPGAYADRDHYTLGLIDVASA